MNRYASNTLVSVERSKAEIEHLLQKYGANKFASGWSDNEATIAFEAQRRYIKFHLLLPDKNSKEFNFTPSQRKRKDSESAYKAWEQACRQRWRALALVIKAKLEAVQSGITTFENEFLAHIVLPNGETVGRMVKPEIEAAYLSKQAPKLLLLGSGKN